MTAWIGKVEGTGINFGDYNTAAMKEWCKKNPGAPVRLETALNPVSQEMRGYYFGPYMSWLRTLVPEWKELKGDELHEVLKKAFNYFEAWNPLTKRNERFGQSVMADDRRNKLAMEYLMRISDWAMENYGQSPPDPETYKKWRDSSPLAGEKYPGDGQKD